MQWVRVKGTLWNDVVGGTEKASEGEQTRHEKEHNGPALPEAHLTGGEADHRPETLLLSCCSTGEWLLQYIKYQAAFNF